MSASGPFAPDGQIESVAALMRAEPSIATAVLQYAKRAASNVALQLDIRQISGEEVVVLQAKSKESIKGIEEKVVRSMQLDSQKSMRLVYGGDLLHDKTKTLKALNIKTNSIIHVFVEEVPKRPKHPPSAFSCFVQDIAPQLKEVRPLKEKATIVQHQWAQMELAARSAYDNQHLILKDAYDRDMKRYQEYQERHCAPNGPRDKRRKTG